MQGSIKLNIAYSERQQSIRYSADSPKFLIVALRRSADLEEGVNEGSADGLAVFFFLSRRRPICGAHSLLYRCIWKEAATPPDCESRRRQLYIASMSGLSVNDQGKSMVLTSVQSALMSAGPHMG